MTLEKIDASIEACFARLATILNEDPLLAKNFPHSLFPIQVVANFLANIRDARIQPHIEQLLDATVSRKGEMGSWNYISTTSRKIYPDDLDDTFVSLLLLARHRPDFINIPALADIARLLKTSSVADGGPYTTWLIDHKENPAWYDIDPVVNSTIAFFLHTHNIEFKKLHTHIEHLIATRNYSSKYYLDELVAMYSIARWYSGNLINQLTKHILQRLALLNMKKENSLLLLALGTSSLILLHADQKCIDANILMMQSLEGTWSHDPFYYEYRGKTKNISVGHEAITLGACLETFQLFKKTNYAQPAASLPWLAIDRMDLFKDIRAETIRGVRRDTTISSEFKLRCLWWVRKITKGNTGKEILLMPWLFAMQDSRKMRELSLANAYGWIAYTIYDIAYDEGNTHHLGVAHYFLRRSYMLYFRHGVRCSSLIKKVFSEMDATNDAEKRGVSLPPEHLHKKSAGHILGLLILLHDAGFSEITPAYKNIVKALENYLCIKQISDDLQDWHEDLLLDTRTPVTISIFKHYSQKFGNSPDLFDEDTNKLKKIFVECTIPEFAEIARKMQVESLELLEKIECSIDIHPLIKVISHYAERIRITSIKYYFEHIIKN